MTWRRDEDLEAKTRQKGTTRGGGGVGRKKCDRDDDSNHTARSGEVEWRGGDEGGNKVKDDRWASLGKAATY